MRSDELELLKVSCCKRARIRCIDGEIIIADILFVSESEHDVIYDLVSTNRSERYSARTGAEAYSTPFDEIESIELVRVS